MIVDSYNEFSDAQSVTATAASTNVLDLSNARPIGKGKPLYLIVQVDTAISGTTPTVTIAFQTDDNEAFASPTAITVGIPQLNGTNGTAGARFVATIPYDAVEQYVRLNYTAGGTVSTGAVSAWLTPDEPTSWESFPDAVN